MNRTFAVAAALFVCAAPARALDLPSIGVPDIGVPKIGLPKLFGGEDGKAPPPGATPDCPFIFLDPGASMLRSPAEADSASVRYQLSIRETARECIVDGDKLNMKVGVEGLVILGPLGQPGSYGGNLRIAVRDIKKDVFVVSKTYRAGESIGSGTSQASFQIITDPIVLPVASAKAQDDYEITIGFTQGGAGDTEKPTAEKAPRPKRRH